MNSLKIGFEVPVFGTKENFKAYQYNNSINPSVNRLELNKGGGSQVPIYSPTQAKRGADAGPMAGTALLSAGMNDEEMSYEVLIGQVCKALRWSEVPQQVSLRSRLCLTADRISAAAASV